MVKYIVVLFKNKKKKKIINKFITSKKAEDFFNKKIKESEDVIFEVRYESGLPCQYELGLLQIGSTQDSPIYITDELGRNVKVKLDESGMALIRISPYRKQEKIFDLQSNKKITVEQLIRKYLKGDGIKMVSMLNNKIIVQDNEKVFLFSLKNESESSRLLDSMSKHFHKIKRGDCLFVKDFSSPQKKYLYELLESKGFDKKVLYRRTTTHPRSK